MLVTLSIILLFLVLVLFVRDAGSNQGLESRFETHYKPFTAESVVQREYIGKVDQVWKALTDFANYPLWFPGISRLLPAIDTSRYVHQFSFDRFTLGTGSGLRLRPNAFSPYFSGRVTVVDNNRHLGLELTLKPFTRETIDFKLDSVQNHVLVTCTRKSQGLFSFLTLWGFANHGFHILNNLASHIPKDRTQLGGDTATQISETPQQLSPEAVIAQAVQAGLDGNMDKINAIQDKLTRSKAKSALVKAKRSGGLPDDLAIALSAAPPISKTEIPVSNTLPAFDDPNDLVAYVVNKALEGNDEPINSISHKPTRGKAKAALVKAKRTGNVPPMPILPESPGIIEPSEETTEALIARLVAAGLEGNMDEVNVLDDKQLRGKIKAAIVKARRAQV